MRLAPIHYPIGVYIQIMEIIRQKLRVSLHPDRPYLFYGPSQSGKKTTIARVAKEFRLQPRIVTVDEIAKLGSLPSHSIAGRNAFIVRIDSAEVVKTLSGTIVFYTCQDPYSFGASDRINAKFTLVDLSKVLHSSPKLLIANGVTDTDNLKKAPWDCLPELCNRTNSYDKRLEIVSANPMLIEGLLNNFEHTSDIDVLCDITARLSSLDRQFYIEHSGDHLMLMECLTIIRKLRLTGTRGENLNWKRQGQPLRYIRGKPDPNVEYKFSILGHETKLRKLEAKKRESDPAAVDNTVKRPRKAPQCKQCGVPLKGHTCPKKSKSPLVEDWFIKPF
jgi:hypothetical protein